MFKKENRVPSEIKFNNAHSFSSPLFTIKIKKNELGLNRFAVVVSKNIYKKSTARNKAKRLIRAILEKLKSQKSQYQDFLVIVRGDVLKAKKEDLEKNIEEIIVKKNI